MSPIFDVRRDRVRRLVFPVVVSRPVRVLAGRDSHRCLLLETALGDHAGDDGAPDRALQNSTLQDGLLDGAPLHGLPQDGLLDGAPLHGLPYDGPLDGALLQGASCHGSLDCFLCQIRLLKPSRLRSRHRLGIYHKMWGLLVDSAHIVGQVRDLSQQLLPSRTKRANSPETHRFDPGLIHHFLTTRLYGLNACERTPLRRVENPP